ncbi:MAG: Hsp20/alpha crystallin family protein, partial [Flavobacteriaceae bacterium]
SERNETEGNYTRREFTYSSFKRSFTLPESVDEDKIKANYEEGILKFTLPKRKEALPKPKRLIELK